jgi:hypothetical protein
VSYKVKAACRPTGQDVRLGLAVVKLQRRQCEQRSPRSRNRARWTGRVRGRRPPATRWRALLPGLRSDVGGRSCKEPPHRTALAGARHRGSARRRRPCGDLSPLPWRTRSVPACRSKSRSSSASASEIRSPQRHSTAISARLRIPVGARDEQARISAIASGSESTSGGRRRGLEAELVDERPAGGASATAICGLGHVCVQERDHVASDGRLVGAVICPSLHTSSQCDVSWKSRRKTGPIRMEMAERRGSGGGALPAAFFVEDQRRRRAHFGRAAREVE